MAQRSKGHLDVGNTHDPGGIYGASPVLPLTSRPTAQMDSVSSTPLTLTHRRQT